MSVRKAARSDSSGESEQRQGVLAHVRVHPEHHPARVVRARSAEAAQRHRKLVADAAHIKHNAAVGLLRETTLPVSRPIMAPTLPRARATIHG